MRWARIYKNLKNSSLKLFFHPFFYSEFWMLKCSKINSHHYQPLINHHKSRINLGKPMVLLGKKTKGFMSLISHLPIIYFIKINFQQSLVWMEIISLVWKQLEDLLRDIDLVDYHIMICSFWLWIFLSEILSDLIS